MATLGTSPEALRERALLLSAELGIDPASWYLRVLEAGRAEGEKPDLGALIRVYWELQRHRTHRSSRRLAAPGRRFLAGQRGVAGENRGPGVSRKPY